jgi:hypothetical protein
MIVSNIYFRYILDIFFEEFDKYMLWEEDRLALLILENK